MVLVHIVEWLQVIALFIFKVCMYGFFISTTLLGTGVLLLKITDKLVTKFLMRCGLWSDVVFFFQNKEEIRSMRVDCEEEERKFKEEDDKEFDIEE